MFMNLELIIHILCIERLFAIVDPNDNVFRWSNPDLRPHSVETIFHKGEKHLPDSLKRYYDEIKLILAKGIIEE